MRMVVRVVSVMVMGTIAGLAGSTGKPAERPRVTAPDDVQGLA